MSSHSKNEEAASSCASMLATPMQITMTLQKLDSTKESQNCYLVYSVKICVMRQFLNCIIEYHHVNWASVSEPHTSELNRDFSSNIIIIIICRTSFRIFLTL